MDSTYILFGIGILITIIGFFARTSFAEVKGDLKKTKEDLVLTNSKLGKVEGKMDLVESQTKSDISSLKDLNFQSFASVGQQLDKMERMILHADNTMKTNGQLFAELLSEIKKKEK